MSDFYVASDAHKYEAEVAMNGYGSRLLIDGVEVPQLRSFAIEASVDGASLTVEVMSIGKVVGEVPTIKFSSVVAVVMLSGYPIRVFGNRDDANSFIEAQHGSDQEWGFAEVPIEVSA